TGSTASRDGTRPSRAMRPRPGTSYTTSSTSRSFQVFFLATTLIRQADAKIRAGLLPEGSRMGHGNALTQMLARRLGLPVPELAEDYLAHRQGRAGQPATSHRGTGARSSRWRRSRPTPPLGRRLRG